MAHTRINFCRLGQVMSFLSFKEILSLLINKLIPRERTQLKNLLEKKNKVDFLIESNFRILDVNDSTILSNTIVNGVSVELLTRILGSDAFVAKQILVDREYDFVLTKYRERFNSSPSVIIDAGSNIGCTILYMLVCNPNAKVIAVEPDISNLTIAKNNILRNGYEENVIFLNNALWPYSSKVSVNSDFRDGLDWSLSVKLNVEGEVDTVTPFDLLTLVEGAYIDLLKIDIEGAEAELFGDESNLDWLNKVKAITIEIHPEKIDPVIIQHNLKKHDFELFIHGELTIGFRRKSLIDG